MKKNKSTFLPGAIIVLGSSNTSTGKLSSLGKNRAKKAYEIWTHNSDYHILFTGGFGPHFNKTSKPHGYYVQEFMETLGFPRSHSLGIVESFNTVEDAFLSKIALQDLSPSSIIVVTSEFHIPRAQWIFQNMLPGCPLKFIGAADKLKEETLKRLKTHENNSFQRFLKANTLL